MPRANPPPLAPSPLADQGILRQEDLGLPGQRLNARRYQGSTLSLQGVPGGRLQGADLSRSSFAEVAFTGVHSYARCLFQSCDLRRMTLKDAGQAHSFLQCDLRGAALGQAQLERVVFRECDLSGTQWRGTRLDRIRFEHCRMEQVSWDGVDLSRVVMTPDMLATVDFTGASRLPQNHPRALPVHQTAAQAATQPAPKPVPPPAAQPVPLAPAQPGAAPADVLPPGSPPPAAPQAPAAAPDAERPTAPEPLE